MAQHRKAFHLAAGDASVTVAQARKRRDGRARVFHVAEIFGIDHQIVFRLAPIQQQVHPSAELERRSVEIAGGPQIDLRVRHRRPGAIAIALRKNRLVFLGQHEAARRHARGLEDLFGDAILVLLARDLLDQIRGDGIARIRIRHARPGLPAHHPRARVDRQHLLERHVRRIRDVVHLVEVHVVEARRVLQQVDDPHRMRRLPCVVDANLGGDLRHRRIEIDLVVQVHLHDRRGNERLADRAGAEMRVGGHRGVVLAIGQADAARPLDPRHAHQGQARPARPFH